MDMIRAMFCAVVVATPVSACGGVLHDAAPTDRSIASVATSELTSPCSSATADNLKAVALRGSGTPWVRRYFDKLSQRDETFTVTKVLCSGDWAVTHIRIPVDDPNMNPPSLVLYHHEAGGDWRAVQYGSGFDCINEGVSPSIAAEIEC